VRWLRPPAPSERSSGAAAVEFALLFPLFILIVFGIIDMGFAFNQKINLTQAAREGSRYGATLSLLASHATSGTPDGTVDTWLANVQKVVLDAGGDDLKATRANRYVCVAYVTATVTKSLTVGTGGPLSSAACKTDGRSDDRVQVVVKSNTALDFLLFGGSITVGSESVTHFEAVPT
jgi:Flp pilus assembly protein TadG